MYAAGLDVVGAVAALFPGAGSAVSLGTGIGSSALMASADLNRGKSG